MELQPPLKCYLRVPHAESAKKNTSVPEAQKKMFHTASSITSSLHLAPQHDSKLLISALGESPAHFSKQASSLQGQLNAHCSIASHAGSAWQASMSHFSCTQLHTGTHVASVSHSSFVTPH